MCGIVGYVGPRQANDFLIEGLRRLEYRGYDSAGIATELVDARQPAPHLARVALVRGVLHRPALLPHPFDAPVLGETVLDRVCELDEMGNVVTGNADKRTLTAPSDSPVSPRDYLAEDVRIRVREGRSRDARPAVLVTHGAGVGGTVVVGAHGADQHGHGPLLAGHDRAPAPAHPSS